MISLIEAYKGEIILDPAPPALPSAIRAMHDFSISWKGKPPWVLQRGIDGLPHSHNWNEFNPSDVRPWQQKWGPDTRLVAGCWKNIRKNSDAFWPHQIGVRIVCSYQKNPPYQWATKTLLFTRFNFSSPIIEDLFEFEGDFFRVRHRMGILPYIPKSSQFSPFNSGYVVVNGEYMCYLCPTGFAYEMQRFKSLK